jgi:homoserine O-acetyltransferase
VIRALAALLAACASGTSLAAEPERLVSGRTLVSFSAPAVRLELEEAFRYVGGQRFVLYDVADAEQHLFVDADPGGRIRRAYWFQFEAYLPGRGGTYKYEGESVDAGGLSFVSNAAARSTAAEPRAGSDGARVRELLAAKGLKLPPEILWQRLVHLTDEGRRRELMIVYMEDLAPTGLAAADLGNGGKAAARWPELAAGLLARARAGLELRWLLLDPDAAELKQRAPSQFQVRLETSQGEMLLEVRREWAPHGVDRFYNLVRAGYYDGVRFSRVVKDRWAQFGIHGDPKVSNAWRARTIPDDPRVLSNVRGTLAFAFAVPNGRTTQVFFNLEDNSETHDKEPFAPFARVVQGIEVMDQLYSDYGEAAGSGIRSGRQGPLFEGGNAYLAREFPRLDFIVRASVLR